MGFLGGFADSLYFFGHSARAFEGEFLDGCGPAGELSGAGFGLGADLAEGVGVFSQAGAVFDYGHHGADFAGGAAGDGDEGEEFGGGGSLEAFGDVV